MEEVEEIEELKTMQETLCSPHLTTQAEATCVNGESASGVVELEAEHFDVTRG